MLPRKTTVRGLSEKSMYNLVVLEETISRSQKAFISNDTSVTVS